MQIYITYLALICAAIGNKKTFFLNILTKYAILSLASEIRKIIYIPKITSIKASSKPAHFCSYLTAEGLQL